MMEAGGGMAAVHNELKLVRVFIGSPGDLTSERDLIQKIVARQNQIVFGRLGYQVSLIRWEDSLPGVGRPQERINKELETCDLFIGMLHKRWGSPTGKFSSGFEEEFRVSLGRNKKTALPEMAIYFKEVDAVTLADPGVQLKQVLSFRKELEENREVMFKPFNDENFAELVETLISSFVIDLYESAKVVLEDAATEKSNKDTEARSEAGNSKKLSSPEVYSFLEGFVKSVGENGDDDIKAEDAARLRLIGSLIGTAGNPEHQVGAHDANTIFLKKSNLDLSRREIRGLIHAGLVNIQHNNTPLWHWEKIDSERVPGILAYLSASGMPENITTGALRAMTMAGVSIPEGDDQLDRSYFIDSWTNPVAPSEVQIAALNYLKHYGESGDLLIVQAVFERADYKTARAAIEAILGILLRDDPAAALKFAISTTFTSMDEKIIDACLNADPSSLDVYIIRDGFRHQNKRIQRFCVGLALDQGFLSDDEVQLLLTDSNEEIRQAALNSLLDAGRTLALADVRKILVKPKPGGGGIAAALGGSAKDEAGEDLFRNYLLNHYKALPEQDLVGKVSELSTYEDLPYMALVDRYFTKYAATLRQDIDDHFSAFFDRQVAVMKRQIGIDDTHDLVIKTVRLKDYICKQLTRKGMDILSRKGGQKDLITLRKLLTSEYIGTSADDFGLFKKFGSFGDIELLANVSPDGARASMLLSFDSSDDAFLPTALALAKGKFVKLLGLPLPSRRMAQIIRAAPKAEFAALPTTSILKLLISSADDVRKATAIKCVLCFAKTRLIALMDAYTKNDNQIFYNVIFWLDYGISVPQKQCRRYLSEMI